MKRFLTLFLMCSFLVSASLIAQNKFLGVNTCVCHKMEKQGNQYKVWEGSAHAKAFETLKSDKANEIAKKKGLTKPAVESPECLKCHVTGYGKAVEASFKPELGIQCETCHGAASAYKAIHNKPENKAKAIAAGLIVPKDDEKLCKECHNSESPTTKEFKYKEMYAKIAHPLKK